MPTVLITGAARGIGRELVTRLVAEGWDVIAGVRDAADGEALRAAHARVTPVVLDVTDEGQVAALDDALPERLDAVVNNAGFALSGPVEGLALDAVRHQFEVNVVGQVAVTQAVLPRLRASRGRVVFISSVSGRVSMPMMGAYTASKFALEALADALRIELRPWGIAVALVEPGAIDTDMWRSALEDADATERALSPANRALYGGAIAAMRKGIPFMQKQASPPAKVADAVVKALTAPRPSARYVVGKDARAQLALHAALPTRAFDAAAAKVIGA